MIKLDSILNIAVLMVGLAVSPIMSAAEPKELAEVPPVPEGAEVLTLGAGCFWCVEAVLEKQEGVLHATSGYMAGKFDRQPTYPEVCTGLTGFAEVVRVVYDPEKLPTDHLLKWFWKLHDPTQLNRQGADVGTQYRSAIFYYDDAQKAAAEKSLAEEDASNNHLGKVVTEITKASTFYPAEKYHQEYYQNNKNAGYCRAVILPKLEKLGLAD